MAVHLLPDRLPHLLRRHLAVDAQREYDADILVPHARKRKLLRHIRQDGIRRHGARNIARDDGDFFAWMHNIFDALRPDRILQRALHLCLAGEGGRRFIRHEDAEEIFIRNIIV